MISRLKFILLFLPAAMALPHAVFADTPEPYHLVRALMRLEQRTALGETKALDQRREFVGRINRLLAEADPAVWSRPDNVDALIIFLLSGGSPSLALGIEWPAEISNEARKLLAGAIAFSRGDRKSAKELLTAVDLRRVEPFVAGSLGLAIASILQDEDEAAARRILEDVELLAPGTLYEETALRRHAMSLDGQTQFEKFVNLVQRYERRFPNSPYAKDFRENVREVVQSVLHSVTKFDDGQIAFVLNVFPKAQRRARLLAAAREAILSGKSDVSVWLSGYLCRDPEADDATRFAAAQLFLLAGLTAKQAHRHRSCPDIKAPDGTGETQAVTSLLYKHLHGDIAAWPHAASPAAPGQDEMDFWAGSEPLKALVARGDAAISRSVESLGGKGPGS